MKAGAGNAAGDDANRRTRKPPTPHATMTIAARGVLNHHKRKHNPLSMKDYAYTLRMKVRDYECDIEGIVNNANYQHYMEHTRHEFLLSADISFAEMLEQDIVSVVARIAIDYKTPLRSRDEFLSCLNIRQEGVRYVFHQDIYRASDMKLAARGKVDVVCLVGGKLSRCPQLEEKLKLYGIAL